MGESKHGGSHLPEYQVWARMKRRCTNPNTDHFDRYGGRGIQVCKRWLSFAAFYRDMGPRPSPSHSIERKDNDKDYGPSNCRWATHKEQVNNRRNTVRWTLDGVTKTVSRWSEETGISIALLHSRFRLGWSLEKVLRTPLNSKRSEEMKGRWERSRAGVGARHKGVYDGGSDNGGEQCASGPM